MTTTHLTNLQQELLKVFSRNLDDKELEEIRDILTQYFANKAIDAANKVWDKKDYTDNDMDKWLEDENQ
jgi:hypothetical protein